ncbi:hypothetical protein OGAPHI_000846 [Ogataea philodendri]|uniref:Uncharacterized protein n=1 Tax=Ogataea philodendri TaxID=1378263 RepID=A0A9P8TA99_9ASCO|nr:uncharacterized protein OGAPHI_000846 [Ogataea philodendri]KAH3671135.1 hypothetical protein OGAPHI_000846 [Ogataea philodendri]
MQSTPKPARRRSDSQGKKLFLPEWKTRVLEVAEEEESRRDDQTVVHDPNRENSRERERKHVQKHHREARIVTVAVFVQKSQNSDGLQERHRRTSNKEQQLELQGEVSEPNISGGNSIGLVETHFPIKIRDKETKKRRVQQKQSKVPVQEVVVRHQQVTEALFPVHNHANLANVFWNV